LGAASKVQYLSLIFICFSTRFFRVLASQGETENPINPVRKPTLIPSEKIHHGITRTQHRSPCFVFYHPRHRTLTCDRTTLREYLLDTITSATFSDSYVVDLANAVGGNTAYIGFTAGHGLGAANRATSGYSDVVVPEPIALPAFPNGLFLIAEFKKNCR
jgi:hypothetical protein